MGLTYREAGVDIEEADRFVSLITPLVRATFRPEVISDIGSFNALFKLDLKKYREPVLVSGTDGVGTKLKIAFMLDRHDTVGIDLVAMCVNDILTAGAEPLFFLDYIATGKLSPEKSVEIVKGIAEGCRQAGCALIGGETAEMPGFYQPGEYDLCGFAVGVVEEKEIITGREIKEGDIIIGLYSRGLHSNGYSLAREIISRNKLDLSLYLQETGRSLGEELLEPTRIYVKAFMTLKGSGINVKGMAHITGGGVTGNLPRILPDNISAVIDKRSWNVPFIFQYLQKLGDVPEEEMFRTFNMGIGYIIVVPSGQGGKVINILKEAGYDASQIGFIEKGNKGVRYV
ncbi:MAG: phosphoribosylformylglycinamidine cyclo-ligase [Thermodesulfovibrionales bacterium]|nr:phosphoribosylformylglycinamidine cyclo-ligase [Thermodesulfovibrionales bacterium]